MNKVTIELKELKIRAFHGYYKKEQEIGSFFNVNLIVQYNSVQNQTYTIENTINYENLFKIVTQEMEEVRPLLEDVCSTILEKVKVSFPNVTNTVVSIEKLNPPITYFNGKSVKVTMERKYE